MVAVTLTGMITIQAYLGPLVVIVGLVIVLAKDRSAACEAMIAGVRGPHAHRDDLRVLRGGRFGPVAGRLRPGRGAGVAREFRGRSGNTLRLARFPDHGSHLHRHRHLDRHRRHRRSRSLSGRDRPRRPPGAAAGRHLQRGPVRRQPLAHLGTRPSRRHSRRAPRSAKWSRAGSSTRSSPEASRSLCMRSPVPGSEAATTRSAAPWRRRPVSLRNQRRSGCSWLRR